MITDKKKKDSEEPNQERNFSVSQEKPSWQEFNPYKKKIITEKQIVLALCEKMGIEASEDQLDFVGSGDLSAETELCRLSEARARNIRRKTNEINGY